MTDVPTVAGSGAGPTTEAGPLGHLDPVDPGSQSSPPGPLSAAPSTPIVRASFGSALATMGIGLFGLIATLVVLGTLAQGIRAQEVFALDVWATPFLHGIATPGLDWVMNRFTDIGSTLVIIPVFAAAAVFLLWRNRRGALLFLLVVSLGALVLDGTMKVLLHRPRPVLAWATVLPDYSFPSGHTMNSLAFYGALALIAWSIAGRRVGLIAIALAALITFAVGVSRIYLGYHYLTDVVGGVLGGIAWLLVVGTALRARPAWQQWRRPDFGNSQHTSDHPPETLA